MRSVTCGLLQHTGQPFRKMVSKTVSAAFDCSLTEREVIRATKDVDWESAQLVIDTNNYQLNNINTLLDDSW